MLSRLLFCILVLANWLQYVWAWVSLGLSCFVFADLLEFVGYFPPDLVSFQLLFIQKSFSSILFLISVWDLITQILDLQLVSHRLLRLCTFFLFHFVYHLFICWLSPLSSLFCYWAHTVFFSSKLSIWLSLTFFISLLRLSSFTLIFRVLVIIC